MLFSLFAPALLCNRYDDSPSAQEEDKNIAKWSNGGIINLLLNGLTYITCENFARCLHFSSPLWGSEKNYATYKISARIILYVKETRKGLNT